MVKVWPGRMTVHRIGKIRCDQPLGWCDQGGFEASSAPVPSKTIWFPVVTSKKKREAVPVLPPMARSSVVLVRKVMVPESVHLEEPEPPVLSIQVKPPVPES
jgi:hypothetical protein